MNGYKKIFKSQSLRIKILQFLDFLPDSIMLKLQYRIKLGRTLNLKNPQRYSEKLQWLKLYYRDEKMVHCADKYEVRNYVRTCGLEEILNECYGIYENVEDIHLEDLPQSFVIKDTLGGGGNSVILVYDKSKIDWGKIKIQMQSWLDTPVDKKNVGREWVYDGGRHRIIIEKLLIQEGEDLPDYKFFCFDGKVYCLYFMEQYTQQHDKGVLGFLTPEFELLPVYRADFQPMTHQPAKPQNYEKMVEMAQILSKGFPHVRVDFYNIDGKIIFGETTFFNASGYTKFEPDAFDYELGEQLQLPLRNRRDKR